MRKIRGANLVKQRVISHGPQRAYPQSWLVVPNHVVLAIRFLTLPSVGDVFPFRPKVRFLRCVKGTEEGLTHGDGNHDPAVDDRKEVSSERRSSRHNGVDHMSSGSEAIQSGTGDQGINAISVF